jgi:hypothetical protein
MEGAFFLLIFTSKPMPPSHEMFPAASVVLASPKALRVRQACFQVPAHRRLPEPPREFLVARTGGQGHAPEVCRAKYAEDLARLLPAIACGEESAVLVFDRESQRIATAQDGDARRHFAPAFDLIASQEAVHEAILERLAQRLPPAPDDKQTRRIARAMFVRAGDRQPAVQFARIAEIDSTVCTLFSMLKKTPMVLNSPTLEEIVGRILRDESHHVCVSHHYLRSLPNCQVLGKEVMTEIREHAIHLYSHLGGSLERLGIDTDKLARRIRRRRLKV